jgi:hypothetical protein
MCSSSFLTFALGGVSGQRHASAALCPRGKDLQYQLDRMSGPQLVWTQRLEEKSFASTGDRTPVVQSVRTEEMEDFILSHLGGVFFWYE